MMISPRTATFRYRVGRVVYALQGGLSPRRLRRMARHRWQRMQRGYSIENTWNFDAHLAEVIAGGARELRKRHLSHPADMTDDEWISTLMLIEDGFTAASRILDLEWDSDEEYKNLIATFEVGMTAFQERFFDLWD